MFIKSLLENVSNILFTVNWAMKLRKPVIEPELSNKITISLEQVAVSMYQDRLRQSYTSMPLLSHTFAKKKFIIKLNNMTLL